MGDPRQEERKEGARKRQNREEEGRRGKDSRQERKHDRQSKRSSKDQMQHSQKSSFASSSQFSSPRQSNKKDSLQTVNQQDLRLPLRAVSQQETFRSPRSKMGDVPEAWLVFANNSNEHQGGRGGGYGAEQAVPVNLANSIGSRLQASFANINSLRHTPVESLLSEEEEEKAKNANKKRSPWFWGALICLGLIMLVLLIMGIIYAALPSSDSSNFSVVASLNDGGGPCVDYVHLTESWRRIRGPGTGAGNWHCDNQLKEEWYRFEGEAGTQLADERSRPGWEVCGTSRVGWLEGKHPTYEQGVVNRLSIGPFV